MKRNEGTPGNLVCADQVRNVVTAVLNANDAFALCVYRALVGKKCGFAKIHATIARGTARFTHKRNPTPRVMRRHRAIERIHASFNNVLNVFWMSDA